MCTPINVTDAMKYRDMKDRDIAIHAMCAIVTIVALTAITAIVFLAT